MGFIKREWTPYEADKWTKEDWIAIVLSPISYAMLMIGTALSMFLLTIGFVILIAGIIITVIMFYVIDPKLSKISDEYEKKQKHYIEELERNANWEVSNE